MAVCLTHCHRGLAMLVRFYKRSAVKARLARDAPQKSKKA